MQQRALELDEQGYRTILDLPADYPLGAAADRQRRAVRAGIRLLAAAVPQLGARLEALAGRLVDLLPLVRNHVYHPDFGGSFSLKRVLPALVPELSYAGLAIAEGQAASLALEALLVHGDDMPPAERARLRADLLAYCHQDTWGLVRLLERLRGLAEGT
jgi:hypothetical protein